MQYMCIFKRMVPLLFVLTRLINSYTKIPKSWHEKSRSDCVTVSFAIFDAWQPFFIEISERYYFHDLLDTQLKNCKIKVCGLFKTMLKILSRTFEKHGISSMLCTERGMWTLRTSDEVKNIVDILKNLHQNFL